MKSSVLGFSTYEIEFIGLLDPPNLEVSTKVLCYAPLRNPRNRDI